MVIAPEAFPEASCKILLNTFCTVTNVLTTYQLLHFYRRESDGSTKIAIDFLSQINIAISVPPLGENIGQQIWIAADKTTTTKDA